MDNHLHVLCRLDPEHAKSWSPEDVIKRWIAVYPPRDLDLDVAEIVDKWVEHHARDANLVALYRDRLSNLGWLMKALKEPLSRLCNRTGVKGTFWEARYKSITILDEEALLATCAYIDLNPVAAGIAEAPETSKHTSIRQRVVHAKTNDKLEALKEARHGAVAGSKAIGNLEQDHWLVPIEDRRQLPGRANGNKADGQAREGMVNGFSIGSYLLLVEYTRRLFRNGKARISDGVKDVLERLGTSAEFWEHRIKKMLGSIELRGCFFGCKPDSISHTAERRGIRTANLCPQGAFSYRLQWNRRASAI